MSRALAFAYAVLLRAILAAAGALAAYGATGMFTTAGIMPPNHIVLVGAAAAGVCVAALGVRERRVDGIWVALLPAVPYALYAFGMWAVAECPPDHPPLTPTYTCAPVGTHAIAVVAPLVAAAGAVLLVRDLRALAAGLHR